ncbi:hypothetical protein OV450_1466 [Actinobacteria bacterium OV450]|nr:hypothetical protein OV450_1466 [Actinobacteria bacterium OV450]
MSTNRSQKHDPRKCALCRPLRHPAHLKTRRALAALTKPRTAPDSVIGRKNGGAS